MSRYLLIGLGGLLGANARFIVTMWTANKWGGAFPYGTLVINLSGSFILCFLAMALSERWIAHPSLRLALMVGFLGSYTTFSAFSLESLQLIQNGALWPSFIYVCGSVIGGGLAGYVGLLLGRLL
jgi:CrcB protein